MKHKAAFIFGGCLDIWWDFGGFLWTGCSRRMFDDWAKGPGTYPYLER